MKNLRTIILAAGKGTRMKSGTPKVLHTICGRSLLCYVLQMAGSVGSLKTYVVLGHQNQKVAQQLGKEYEIVIQQRLLGTADAVKSVTGRLAGYSGDVLILSGDAPLLRKSTIQGLIRRHQRTGAACTFLTAEVPHNYGYGRVIRSSQGKVQAIREEKDATGSEKNIREINVGVYCFKNAVLSDKIDTVKMNSRKKEFYLTDIIELLAKEGLKIETHETEDAAEGTGVNTRVDLAFCQSVIRQRILEGFMLQGVTIIDPRTTFIDVGVKIGRDTVVHPFTVIEHDVRIGRECSIGPFAHLRPGTKLGNHVSVGNFAEVSRSRVGDHSLMKHFSFLGDATVGRHVNIGAGVVTANYDGKNKNKTKISDEAFIGSDSILVAPVIVGKKAVTGAGSVVTKGTRVPDHQVVLGVPARIFKKKA